MYKLLPDGIRPPTKECYIYARVSTHDQKEDLQRQIEELQSEYPTHQVLSDVGSGLNFNRKGFQALLERTLRGAVEEVVVTHRDRLCRFGFELFEAVLTHHHGKIVVLHQTEQTVSEELTTDLVSIITHFAGKLYGARSHQAKKILNKRAPKKQIKKRVTPQDPQNPVATDSGGEEST